MANSPSSSTSKPSNKPATESSASAPLSNAPKKSPSAVTALRTYWLPLTLLALSLFFQLVVLPSSFPSSHYDVLGIQRGSTVEQVKEAYEEFSSMWNSGTEPQLDDFIKIRYAYELLTNPLWKRDYDLFGFDEQLHLLEDVKQLYAGESYSRITLPLLEETDFDIDDDLNLITSDNSQTVLGGQRPFLIQLYSRGSSRCAQFWSSWKRIAILLSEVADTGVAEVGEVKLAAYFAEKKATGQPFFRNGLPLLVAFPQGCRSSSCFVRYEGELSIDAVTDWFSSAILGLPRIPYYSKDSLGPKFLAKSSHHKVKVIFFSDTGMRATPFVRQTAMVYQDYASFAFVLWREEEFSFWWTVYNLESAPAVLFLKDPGTKPLVYYGSVNGSWFSNVMEQNKLHELPQLRSVTSKDLGCDSRGYSRAGSSSIVWYCVILIGRPGPEMNQRREMLRRVQETLSSENKPNAAGVTELTETSITAFKDKRLTFSWMDGEEQKNLCTFYLGGELSLESCGPYRGVSDSSHIVMVRYMRNDSLDDIKVKRKKNSLLDALQDDVDPTSQLVAHYNGSFEASQILEWVSKIIKDGDSEKLPFYRTKAPELVPENGDLLFLRGSGKVSAVRIGVKNKIQNFMTGFRNILEDPRIGPMFLLGSLMSYGWILLRRSQLTSSTESHQTHVSKTKREVPKEWKNRGRIAPGGDIPPSMTDTDPKDAFQMPLSDSDSE